MITNEFPILKANSIDKNGNIFPIESVQDAMNRNAGKPLPVTYNYDGGSIGEVVLTRIDNDYVLGKFTQLQIANSDAIKSRPGFFCAGAATKVVSSEVINGVRAVTDFRFCAICIFPQSDSADFEPVTIN